MTSEKEDSLSLDRLRSVLTFEPNTGIFRWRIPISKKSNEIGAKAGCINANGYVFIRVGCRQYLAHRLAWLYSHGEWPNAIVDHINGDRSDNRIDNLRLANKSLNGANAALSKRNRVGIKGVYQRNNRWAAQIRGNGRNLWLGTYDTPQAAQAAYLTAAKEFFGEFARDAVSLNQSLHHTHSKEG